MSGLLAIVPRTARPLPDGEVAISPLLGLASVAAVMREQGVETRVLDLYAEPLGAADLAAALAEARPELVALYTYTENVGNVLRVARLVKEARPSTPVVAAGPHVAFRWNDVLAEPAVEAAILGEGELIAPCLWDALVRGGRPLAAVPGLAVRSEHGGIVRTPAPSGPPDLDALPSPERSLFPLERYIFPTTATASRGCPGRCIYCGSAVLGGGRFRLRSAGLVAREIRALAALGVDYVHFWDDTFTASATWVAEFCRCMSELRTDVGWYCGTRVDAVSEEMFQAMAAAGCIHVNFGIESGDETILRRIGKQVSLSQAEQAVRWASGAGLHVSCNFMLPHPDDTEETVHKTFAFARRLVGMGAGLASFNLTTPFPGTPLFEHPERFGVQFVTHSYEDFSFFTPVFETRHLKLDRIRELFLEAWYIQCSTARRPHDLRLAGARPGSPSCGSPGASPHS